jgi:hypothetical protein
MLIESSEMKSGKPGAQFTLYSIVVDIQKQIQTLEKYPDLISKMQKNDSIVENIFREHLDLISSSDSGQKDGVEQLEVTLFEKTEKSFKEKLQLSPKFFRLFLITDKNKLINNIKKLIGSLENGECITDRKCNQDLNNGMEMYGITFDINRIFKACVSRDIFKKQGNEESIEYLKRTQNELSKEKRKIEFKKYLRTKNELSDVDIHKLRKEVIKLLNQTKKEILNAEIEKLKKIN